jgi:hypothetical protein
MAKVQVGRMAGGFRRANSKPIPPTASSLLPTDIFQRRTDFGELELEPLGRQMSEYAKAASQYLQNRRLVDMNNHSIRIPLTPME